MELARKLRGVEVCSSDAQRDGQPEQAALGGLNKQPWNIIVSVIGKTIF